MIRDFKGEKKCCFYENNPIKATHQKPKPSQVCRECRRSYDVWLKANLGYLNPESENKTSQNCCRGEARTPGTSTLELLAVGGFDVNLRKTLRTGFSPTARGAGELVVRLRRLPGSAAAVAPCTLDRWTWRETAPGRRATWSDSALGTRGGLSSLSSWLPATPC